MGAVDGGLGRSAVLSSFLIPGAVGPSLAYRPVRLNVPELCQSPEIIVERPDKRADLSRMWNTG